MSTRLERSTANRVVAGVCGGIAEYLQVDPTLVRVFFVIGTFATAGLGFLAYLVLLVLMPLPGHPTPFVKTDAAAPSATPDPATPESTTAAPRPLTPPSDPEAAERRRAVFGYILIALGIVFLLGNSGAFAFVNWRLIWPLVLVGIGVLLLAQRTRR